MRVLAVVCGPSRPGLPEWSELMADVVKRGTASLKSNKRLSASLFLEPEQQQHSLVSSFDPERIHWDIRRICDGIDSLPGPSSSSSLNDSSPNFYDAVVISGSRHNITECHWWAEEAAAWLRRIVISPSPLPILGICFGHQLLAHAFGGRVDFNPNGPELGTTQVHWSKEAAAAIAKDPLFSAYAAVGGNYSSIAAVRGWKVQEVHFQSVVELPNNTISFASSSKDPNQILQFSSYPGVYGVQFHPEYPLSYMRALGDQLNVLKEAGPVRTSFLHGLTESDDEACSIIARFLALAHSKAFSWAHYQQTSKL